jgi:hypothetical protein
MAKIDRKPMFWTTSVVFLKQIVIFFVSVWFQWVLKKTNFRPNLAVFSGFILRHMINRVSAVILVQKNWRKSARNPMFWTPFVYDSKIHHFDKKKKKKKKI